MRHPNIINAYTLTSGFYSSSSTCLKSGQWVPARPLGFATFASRVRLAWMVFTGRADALWWPEQESEGS